MSYDPARPRYSLEFAGTTHELVGTMEMIEAVEAAFKDGVVQVTNRVMRMGLTETSKLVSAICKVPANDVANHIHNVMGVSSDAFILLQSHLYAFLRITLEPPEARERMAKKLGEWFGKQPASPGDSIKNSASAT